LLANRYYFLQLKFALASAALFKESADLLGNSVSSLSRITQASFCFFSFPRESDSFSKESLALEPVVYSL
jgi:hypothetical protein